MSNTTRRSLSGVGRRVRVGAIAGALSLASVLGAGACGSSQALTQGEIGRRGARSFAAPMPTVFYAVIGVLMAEGYEIASSDPQQGVILTKPLAINTGGPVTARAYRVTVTADGDARSRVV